ncbi:hypothetical protein BJ508DRAFT_372876 [Ascobolus immersus RN42]|uniref:Uncharacterized protein n=1 Tax=Ascobolus immersus RN42 TaxID=1160509 RepID=A0A3N4IKI5_ASCIM|nr:hypothetical protein BJ508DRAFT_372876 [Ascobolus immersus RN42]
MASSDAKTKVPVAESSTEVEALPSISIHYCPACNWMLRATYAAQELLHTFSNNISSVSLHPSRVAGVYRIEVHVPQQADIEARTAIVWERKADNGFPDIKILKRRVRDIVSPGTGLGHIDRHGGKEASVVKEEQQKEQQEEQKDEHKEGVAVECTDCKP